MAKKEKKKSTFWKDFRSFVSRGNVIDMAVGVVIGGSFGKIVTGLVNYIINPFVGMFMKQGSLDTVKTVITEAVIDAEGVEVTPEVAILWGTWIQTILDFVITALCIFVVVRLITAVRNKLEAEKLAEEAAKAAAAKQAADEAAAALAQKQAQLDASVLKQEALLAEIRDLLKNK